MKLFIVQRHSPVTSFLLGPNILLRILLSNTLNLWYYLKVRDQIPTHAKQLVEF
jgi:hypothetical protein